MKNILILIHCYYPGYKAGGPQNTVKQIVETYGNKSNISILTKNHDVGEKTLYELETNCWIPVGNAKVKYLSDKKYNLKSISKAYKDFDMIYACGIFEVGTILILIIHRFSGKKKKDLYVASMGVFSKGALSLKTNKKRIFIFLCKLFGFFNDIKWCFSSIMEKAEAEACLGSNYINQYLITRNIPKKANFNMIRSYIKNYNKKQGELRIIFLSRISPKKNIEFCADILNSEFTGTIRFDIYGICSDNRYLQKCKEAFRNLPSNIIVEIKSEIRPEETIKKFSEYDVFLFPTKGENYGHAIFESLAGGCIPIISDQTPWSDIMKLNCGFVFSLNEIEKFRETIRRLLVYDTIQMVEMKKRAIDYAENDYKETLNNTEYKQIFG